MKRNEYSAGSVSYSFWFMEFRKVVQLLSEGKTFEDIKRLSEEENLFGAPSKARAKSIYSVTVARVKALDESFIPVFLESDLATQKQFVLAANLAYDTLFFDFVYEVVREKMIIGSDELEEADIRIFFKNKQEQDDRVAGYTDETIRRLIRSYKTQLFEAGLLDDNTRATTRKILKPILDASVKHWLEDFGYGPIVKAMEGIR
jgi:hypothetical protein